MRHPGQIDAAAPDRIRAPDCVGGARSDRACHKIPSLLLHLRQCNLRLERAYDERLGQKELASALPSGDREVFLDHYIPQMPRKGKQNFTRRTCTPLARLWEGSSTPLRSTNRRRKLAKCLWSSYPPLCFSAFSVSQKTETIAHLSGVEWAIGTSAVPDPDPFDHVCRKERARTRL